MVPDLNAEKSEAKKKKKQFTCWTRCSCRTDVYVVFSFKQILFASRKINFSISKVFIHGREVYTVVGSGEGRGESSGYSVNRNKKRHIYETPQQVWFKGYKPKSLKTSTIKFSLTRAGSGLASLAHSTLPYPRMSATRSERSFIEPTEG